MKGLTQTSTCSSNILRNIGKKFLFFSLRSFYFLAHCFVHIHSIAVYYGIKDKVKELIQK